MSPRTKFWLFTVAGWTAIGLSFPVDGPLDVGLGLFGIALCLCALRVLRVGAR